MGERWTAAQVNSLAPDAASQKAGAKLGVPGPWTGTGFQEEGHLVWGDCKGSGSKPYQVTVSVADTDVAYQCTCPSRKFPCKHGLGLLLLWAAGTVTETDALPDRVEAWSAQRRERSEKAAARSEDSAQKAGSDPAAAARRTAQRHDRIGHGLADLDRWLTDQVAAGFAFGGQGHGAVAGGTGYAAVDPVAKRLVDAQAPGVAAKVRALTSIRSSGDGWPDLMLAEFAQLHLLCEAWSRLESLPEPLQDTVKRRVGISVDTDTVRREGERVADRWHVLGSRDRRLDKLTERRIWLRGEATGRNAMLLAFGAMQAAPALAMPAGAVYEAEFAFHNEALPLRALAEPAEAATASGAVPVGGTLAEAAEAFVAALAVDPWTDGWPVVIGNAVPRLRDGNGDGARSGSGSGLRGGGGNGDGDGGGSAAGRGELTDGAGGSVPLICEEPSLWRLLAVSGGHPVTVFGEYTDAGLEPLTAWSDDTVVSL